MRKFYLKPLFEIFKSKTHFEKALRLQNFVPLLSGNDSSGPRDTITTFFIFVRKLSLVPVLLLFTIFIAEKSFGQTIGDYRSKASGNWSAIGIWETFNGTIWVGAGAAPTSVNGVITIQSPHIVTIAGTLTVDQVIINSGAEIDLIGAIALTIANGAGTDFDVSGIFKNSSTVAVTTTGTLNIANGGTYEHAVNGGVIPIATWGNSSTIKITGCTTTMVALPLSVGNVVWNSTGQSVSGIFLGGTPTTINGDLTIINTGTGAITMANGSPRILNIIGKLNLQGGTFTGTTGAAAPTLNIGGDINLTGGVFNSTTGAGFITITVGGNWTKDGSTFNSGTGSNIVIFNGTTQSIGGLTASTFNNLSLAGSGTKTFGIATTISGGLSISNGVIANLGTFTSTANTLTLNGVVQSSGVSYGGTGSGATIINTTYFSANTGILNIGAVCVTGQWLGATSTDWSVASNWCGGIVPTSATNVVIPSGTPNQPSILSGTTALCNNITINPGATLTLASSATSLLNISGNFTNNGIFTAGAASFISFVGTAQTIGGSTTPTSFSNLTIAGSNIKTLLLIGTTAVVGSLNVISPAILNLSGNVLTAGDLQGNGGITNTGVLVLLTNGGDNTTTTFSGVISGAVSLSKQGTGTLTLSGNSTYTGTTRAGSGFMKLGANGTAASGPLGIAGGAGTETMISNGPSLDLNGFSTAEPFTINAGGKIKNTSSTASTISGLITMAAGASIDNLETTNGDIYVTNTGTITGATFPLSLGGSFNGTISSIIGTGLGTLTKNGTGTWTLSGASTYTGTTAVNLGTLKAGSNQAFGIASAVILSNVVTAKLDITGFNNTIGSLTGGIVGSNIILGGATLTIGSDNTSPAAYAGVISGTGSVIKSGSGILILSGSNIFTGSTTISAGELRLNPSSNTTLSTQIVLNGGILSTTGIITNRTITSSSTLKLDASSSINLGSNTHTLTFASSSGIVWIAGTTLTINGWTGSYNGTTGTAGKIFIGSNGSGLSASQANQIQFKDGAGILYLAMLLSTGELVPVANTITTGAISGSSFCPGTTGINVPFTYSVAANFIASAIFTAQLSDAFGSFTSPINLQTVAGNASGSQSIPITIPSGTLPGSGYRIRVIRNTPALNGSDNGSNITVNASPAITGHPSSIVQVLCVNNIPNVLSTTATGAGLTYQWYSNSTASNIGGAFLTGATSSTYTPVTSSSGTLYYYVVVSGTCSPSVTSNISGAITVNDPPVFTTQPSSQTVCSNTSVTFFAVASGTGTLSYQWYKGATLLTNGPRIAGATTPTISLSSLNAASAGNYSVAVMDASGCIAVMSNNAVLIVNQEINITIQPVLSQTLCEASNVTFDVTAQGTGPFSVQWYNGITPINNSSKYTIFSTTDPSTIPPTITTSLTINAIVPSDASNNYYVIISNPSGICPVEVSNDGELVVTPQPAASISYPASYCTSAVTAKVTQTGTIGGTYSKASGPGTLAINVSTGDIILGSSAPGTYTVDYTIAASGGCALYFTTSASIIITAQPAATISYASSYCSSSGTASVTQTGTTGGTYSKASGAGTLSLNAVTGNINLAGSTPGTYTVAYAIAASGACALFSTTSASIIITAQPAATISYAASSYCTSLVTATVSRTGTAGGTFSKAAGAGTLNINSSTGDINLAGSTPGTYTIAYTIAASGGCALFSTTSASVTISPIATLSTNITTLIVCSGTNAIVTLRGLLPSSTSAVSYQIASGSVQIINGVLSNSSGEAFLNIPVTYANNGQIVTITSISSSINGFPACNTNFTGYTVTLNVKPLPVITSALSGSACTGVAQNYLITSDLSPATYSWSRPVSVAGITPNTILNQTTNPIIETLISSLTAPANVTYKIIPTVNGCSGASFSRIVTVYAVSLGGTLPSTAVCSGSGVSLTLTGSRGNVNQWQFSTDGGTTWGLIANTTTSYTYSNITTTTLFRVQVQSGNCAFIYSTVATISVHNLWVGGTGSNWNTASNWSDGLVPSVTCPAVTIPAVTSPNVYPVLSTGAMATINNLVINSGASLTITGNTLQIAGAITNNGTFDVTGGALEFNGASAQTIPANVFATNKIKDLIISNNVSIAAASGQDSLTGMLTFSGSNKTFNTNDKLTLKSTAANTAAVGQIINGNSISGNVTVERYISAKRAWRFLSVPTNTTQTFHQGWQENQAPLVVGTIGYGTQVTNIVNPTPANGFDYYSAAGPSVKKYDITATGPYAPYRSINATSDLMATTEGIMTFVRGDRTAVGLYATPTITVLRTQGPLKTQNQTYTVSPGAFKSIGNPYAAPLDMRQVDVLGTKEFFYIWDPNLTGPLGLGAFQTFALVGGNYYPTPGGGSYPSQSPSAAPYNYIQSGSAFFVAGDPNATSNKTVTITESSKASSATAGNVLVFRPASANQTTARINTNLYAIEPDASLNLVDGTLNQFADMYSNAIDRFDAVKITNFAENLAIKTDGQLLVVERKQSILRDDTIHLNMLKMKVKSYRFEFIGQNFALGLTGFLEDSYYNTRIPLNINATTTYDFNVINVPGSWNPDRFRIVFATAAASVLPVTFTSVKAYPKDNDIAVDWKVEDERNIKAYEVERSADGQHFSRTGTVEATGNNGSSVSYQWPDIHPLAGSNYYRIKSIGISGEVIYSNIVKVVTGSSKAQLMVYPNPVSDGNINLQLINQPKGSYGIRLMNKLGQVIMVKQIDHQEGSSTEHLSVKLLAHGAYNLEVTLPDNTQTNINVLY